MENIEFTKKMTDILIKQNDAYSLDNYAFCCSEKWNNGLKEYK
jgi:hypothetical protein